MLTSTIRADWQQLGIVKALYDYSSLTTVSQVSALPLASCRNPCFSFLVYENGK